MTVPERGADLRWAWLPWVLRLGRTLGPTPWSGPEWRNSTRNLRRTGWTGLFSLSASSLRQDGDPLWEPRGGTCGWWRELECPSSYRCLVTSLLIYKKTRVFWVSFWVFQKQKQNMCTTKRKFVQKALRNLRNDESCVICLERRIALLSCKFLELFGLAASKSPDSLEVSIFLHVFERERPSKGLPSFGLSRRMAIWLSLSTIPTAPNRLSLIWSWFTQEISYVSRCKS